MDGVHINVRDPPPS